MLDCKGQGPYDFTPMWTYKGEQDSDKQKKGASKQTNKKPTQGLRHESGMGQCIRAEGENEVLKGAQPMRDSDTPGSGC